MAAATDRVTTAAGLDLDGLASLMTASFEGYFFPVEMSPEQLAAMIRRETIDLAASRIALSNGKPVGLTLVASRGLSRRVAAMGVVARRRGRGVGRLMLSDVIDESRRTGCRHLLLEVIEANSPARRLYESLGFRQTRTLVSWSRPPQAPTSPTDDRLVEIDAAEVAQAMESAGLTDLPWQLAPATIAGHAPPSSVALRMGGSARALISNVTAEPLDLEMIVVAREYRRRGHGRRLLDALAARYPGKALRVKSRVPGNVGSEFFAATGFESTAIQQIEMQLVL